MSLGSEIAPHLPFLRRYARALFGSQAQGDAFVRAVLESIVAAPDNFPRDVDVRLGLYRTFHRLAAATPTKSPTDSTSQQSVAEKRLSAPPPQARQVLLLRALEGFSQTEVAYLLHIPQRQVTSRLNEAMAAIERQVAAKVLIIEDEPIIAMDLHTIVRELGHEVVGVAVTRAEAVAAAIEREPGLLLVDIQLADDSSGIDAVREILAQRSIPHIFITAYPDRLLTDKVLEPTFLITKPFQRATVKAAISQALFFNEATVPFESAPAAPPTENTDPQHRETVQQLRYALRQVDLAPKAGPLNAVVIDGQARVATGEMASSPTSSRSIEAVRALHLRDIERRCASLVGSNLGPAFTDRLHMVRMSLAETLTETSSLQLGIQIRGLTAMMPTIQERMDDATAADLMAFFDDVNDLVRQFPTYREFVAEARITGNLDASQRAALADASRMLEGQSDASLDASLRDALRASRRGAEDGADSAADLGAMRSVGNVLRAYGRFLEARAKGVGQQAVTTFDKATGGTIGIISAVLLTGPILAGLAMAFPHEFGFVITLAKLAKAMIP